jgi:BirA family biotin operon repressor/biotin-[acetyl-CoA-carboxylase] ligase
MTPLDQKRLLDRARRRQSIGRSVDIHQQAASTNDLAHQAGESSQPPPSGHIIIAEHQTAGRGQRGRTWSAPPRSALLFSVLLDPPPILASPPFLTAWGAIGMAWTLRDWGLPARIKWPNDVLIDDRKVSGILVERRQATIVGIGVNVSVRPEDFPADLRLPATSIEIELGRPVDRTDIFNQLLDQLDALYTDTLARGLEPLWRQWTELAQDFRGDAVRVLLNEGQKIGKLIDVRPDRGARLILPDGQEESIPPELILRVEKLTGEIKS